MMQRCSSSRSSSHRSKVVGHCPCGLFHAPGSSLCLLFGGGGGGDFGDGPFGSPSGVDCTLSLSTPSSRSTANDRSSSRSGGRISNLCWDIFNPKQQPASVGGGAGDGAVQVHHLGGEALLARRCANCDTTSTPLWRNGPRGPKSLCNACGIRYKKEERRASSAAAEVGQHPHPHACPWAYAAAQATHKASPAEFKLIQGDDDGATSAVPFLSWRLNTPGLLHDYT